jgi:hypothetical protein
MHSSGFTVTLQNAFKAKIKKQPNTNIEFGSS